MICWAQTRQQDRAVTCAALSVHMQQSELCVAQPSTCRQSANTQYAISTFTCLNNVYLYLIELLILSTTVIWKKKIISTVHSAHKLRYVTHVLVEFGKIFMSVVKICKGFTKFSVFMGFMAAFGMVKDATVDPIKHKFSRL